MPEMCLYCGGAVDPATRACRACSARAVRRQPVTGIATGCPRCAQGLCPIVVEDAHVFLCERCRGAFVAHTAWDRLVGATREQRALDLAPFVPPPPSPTPCEDTRLPTVECPACCRPMERFTFGARSKTLVDVCEAHGLWFDGAELAAVLAFVRRLWEAGGRIPMTSEEWQDMRLEQTLAAERVASIAPATAAQQTEDLIEMLRLGPVP